MATSPRIRSAALVVAALAVLLLGHRFLVADAVAEDRTELPELPSVQERFSERYDGDGCLRTGQEERDCSVTAAAVDAHLAGEDIDDVRHLAGFSGTLWTDDLTADRVVVLEESVRQSAGTGVELRGLVRNESAMPVDAIEVSATLRGPTGEVLTTLTGPAEVGGVRPGEPVPFVLTGPGLAVGVTHIEWSAAAVDGESVSRNLEWQAYWELPAGLRDPVVNHLYAEAGPGPHPDVLFGAVTNVGSATAAVTVVTVWLDESGGVAALGTTPVVDPGGNALARLDAGASADALLAIVDAPVGAPTLTWVSGS
jgi:hypothetical protein